MVFKTQSRIVFHGRRSGQQDDLAARSQGLAHLRHKPPANTAPLTGCVHREVGQIAAIMKIGHTARQAHQQAAFAACGHQVRVRDHALQAGDVIDRTPGRERGSDEQFAKFFNRHLWINGVVQAASRIRAKWRNENK